MLLEEMKKLIGKRIIASAYSMDTEEPVETVILGISISGSITVYRDKKNGGYTQRLTDVIEHKNTWNIHPNEIVKILPDLPIPKPYPHKCKYCHSPARKIGKDTLCSNRCKNGKKYIRSITKNVVYKQDKELNEEGFIVCPVCGKEARLLYYEETPKPDEAGCDSKHRWPINIQKGYKFRYTDPVSHYVWVGLEENKLNGWRIHYN
jgi:hypothetical protein